MNKLPTNNQRAAVITGSGRGVGQATAKLFAANGYRVVVCARTESEVQATAQAAAALGGDVLGLRCDISNEQHVARLFDTALRRFGRVDVLINAAAILVKQPFAEMTMEVWDEVMATNLRGTVLCCRRAFTTMMHQGGGVIINISSLSGFPNVEKFPGLSAYNVSKYAVAGLSEILAVEGRPYNIRALAVSPGAVDTAMLRQAAPDLKPGMTPDDLARILLFLASDEARHLNGVNLPIFSNA
ncbi:MAG TPA: SDR family oxidoreductase [Ktedonobacterales bacterium]|jgi:NAD(P)-dependent dehydrogenase (short-subunit alcohol dehydrogenase family)